MGLEKQSFSLIVYAICLRRHTQGPYINELIENVGFKNYEV